jgi:hypothetical protein
MNTVNNLLPVGNGTVNTFDLGFNVLKCHPYSMPKNVFSFSFSTVGKPVGKKEGSWDFEKYGIVPAQKITRLLNDEHWKDFGVVMYVNEDMFNEIILIKTSSSGKLKNNPKAYFGFLEYFDTTSIIDSSLICENLVYSENGKHIVYLQDNRPVSVSELDRNKPFTELELTINTEFNRFDFKLYDVNGGGNRSISNKEMDINFYPMTLGYFYYNYVKLASPSLIERFCLIKYYNPTIDSVTFKAASLFYNSFVRYVAMITPYFDTVLIRDAHSTMPNPTNKYDLEWKNTWLTTDKKFWVYHSVIYTPAHNLGMDTMYGAAWGARKLTSSEQTVMSHQQWTNIVGNLVYFENGKPDIGGRQGYGVDERILLFLFNKYWNNNPDYSAQQFLNDTYFVGITHLIYLLIPVINMRLYEGDYFSSTLKRPYDIVPTDFTKDIKTGTRACVPINNLFNPDRSLFSELKCILIYLNKECQEMLGNPPTIDTLFTYIECLIKPGICGDITPPTYLEKKFIDMLPTKAHLWNYLFDVNDIRNLTLRQEYDSMKEFFSKPLPDFENMCDIVSKYFIGAGVKDYSEYEYIGNRGHLDLPDNIELPEDHPHKVDYFLDDVNMFDVNAA